MQKFKPPLKNLTVPTISLIALASVSLIFTNIGFAKLAQDDAVSYNRTLRPLLSKNCFACHGPDEDHREADLRLDDRDSAMDAGVIDLDDPEESELIARINSTDPDDVMPPPKAHPPLSASDQAIILKWIEQGADYEPHWAFVPPVKPVIKFDPEKKWANHPVDIFVAKRLNANELAPNNPADPFTLVRRLYLDLTGLPPSRNEAFAFAKSYAESDANSQEQLYEKLVDRLLASPRYGERWARPWLDMARYADTNGYEKDRERSVWPYRDWVIRALNADMPYDQFSIEQLAGDMLPEASNQQRLATGFHRNTMLNEEGGIDPLEFRFHALVDRVSTTGIVWMGLTTGCAQCHTHKYDPITHTDFYSMLALLNNADEPDLTLVDEEVESKRKQTQSQIEAVKDKLVEGFENLDAKSKSKFVEWKKSVSDSLTNWTSVRPTKLVSNLAILNIMDDDSVFAGGDATKRDVYTLTFSADMLRKAGLATGKITAVRIDAIPDDRLPGGGPGRSFYEGDRGEFFLSEVNATVDGKAASFASASVDSIDGRQVNEELNSTRAMEAIDGNGSSGWSSKLNQPRHLVLNFDTPIQPNSDLSLELLFERHFVAALGRFKISMTNDANARATGLPAEIETIFRNRNRAWDANQTKAAKIHYLLKTKENRDALAEIDLLKEKTGTPSAITGDAGKGSPKQSQNVSTSSRRIPRSTRRGHSGDPGTVSKRQ